MPELNLKQITDKLNAEFTGEGRKLVFWYDDQVEFAEDIDSLGLTHAKVLRLEPDNQFYTKYFLERLDRKTSYLIYAPFSKPPVRDNHLEDTLLYSKRFFADRASLLLVDLGIDPVHRDLIQKYIKFFAAKERAQRFYDLEIGQFTAENIEIGLMSSLCKTRTASFDEVVRSMLTGDALENNKFLAELAKYDLTQAFWRIGSEQFGYADSQPTLEKLTISLFVTYTEKFLHGDLPSAWKRFSAVKSGNVIAFVDSLMNNVLYRDKYDELAAFVANLLNLHGVIEKTSVEVWADCDSFGEIDQHIIRWMTERLLQEDRTASLGGASISALCQLRRKKHFGPCCQAEYLMLENAHALILAAAYKCYEGFGKIAERYLAGDYQLDSQYRAFYYHYDRLAEPAAFEKLRDLVENIYTNEYLGKVIAGWNAGLLKEGDWAAVLPLQRRFYDQFVRGGKDRVVVIISDALRYEVGQALFAALQDDAKCSVTLRAMLGVLPSYTQLGMAALLPHNTLGIDADGKVLIDGQSCDDLKQREAVLRQTVPNSRCIQFDEIKSMKKVELREVFTGMDVVYIYHNQIDARGDKPNTENEVFNACAEAVEEIFQLIKRVSVNANTHHFLVTADHGFIYKRDKLQESDKISLSTTKHMMVNRRFILSDEPVQTDGIAAVELGKVLGCEDRRSVSFPVGANVFKLAGGGQNYVHGGSSPQELILPVLDVKMEKGHVETRNAQVVLVSMIHKIANLIASLDFMQPEPVSDEIRATSYRIFFAADDGEKVSNEFIHMADMRELDPQKRIFRLRFNFKNRQYDKTKPYYLVAVDEKSNVEVLRHSVVMDIVFANNFGFGV
ncbi:MAG: hypothetical protein H6Q76_726 [Firmicutes bacterium]|nr:hypothetical protein [Bacillota bacterium]